MNIHIIPLILLIVYTVITIGVANMVLRKKLGSEHFLVAGRALPLALVIAVVLGDWIGGNATVGVGQRGYTEGLIGSSYSIALGLAMFVFASTMSARFRRLRAITIPEVVGRLFDPKTRLMSAIVIGVAYFIAGITQIIAEERCLRLFSVWKNGSPILPPHSFSWQLLLQAGFTQLRWSTSSRWE